MKTRIYIVEDHEVMRMMLEEYLLCEPDFEVCGKAETAEEALAALHTLAVDLVLVDVSLPGMNGIDFVARAKPAWPQSCFLMLSGHGEVSYMQRALAAGAQGYIVKGDPYELPDAIRQVLRGEVYLSQAFRNGRQPRP